MKTTIELPDDLFREAKVNAARRGVPLKVLFREALEAALTRTPPGVLPAAVGLGAGASPGRLDLPAKLSRQIEDAAKAQGTTSAEFVRSALLDKLGAPPDEKDDAKPEWPYPPLRGVPIEELRRIDRFIEEEFERIEPEDWE